MSNVYFVALSLLLSGCSSLDLPTGPPSVVQAKAIIQPMCWLGCIPPEPGDAPNPSEPGIYLGPLDLATCTSEPDANNDADADGLLNICEYPLATAFAPEMVSSHGSGFKAENIAGERYWLAAPTSTYGADVILLYLPGYYEDLGSPLWASGPHVDSHLGDSEVVALYWS